MLYPLGQGWNLVCLQVDDRYLYFNASGRIYRAAKQGHGQTESIGGGAQEWGHSLVVDATHVYWFTGTSIAKYEKSTGTVAAIFTVEGPPPVMSLAADQDRIYLAAPGCGRLLSVSKSGTDVRAATQDVSEIVGGKVPLATGIDYVYCGGGIGGPTSGNLYRWPKTGGAIELVVDLGDSERGFEPQVGAIAEVSDVVYYIHGFPPARWTHRLAALGRGATSPMTLAELLATTPSHLHYDPVRNALFWFAAGPRNVAKYGLQDKKLRLETYAASAPSAVTADAQYLYFATLEGIHRLAKF